MLIKLLWPTARPQMFIDNHKLWIKKAKYPKKIETYAAVNTENEKSIIEGYSKDINITVIGSNVGVTKPLYEITKKLEGKLDDIIIAAFDDVYCPDNWDEYIYECFKDHDGALYLNDGNQSPDNHKDYLITMPCMTFNCLLKLNRIIFNTAYKHFFADDELTDNLRKLNVLKDCRGHYKPMFKHKHSSNRQRPADNIDGQNYECFVPDRAVFWPRMGMSLEERLKI